MEGSQERAGEAGGCFPEEESSAAAMRRQRESRAAFPQPRVQTDASSRAELELERMSLSQRAKPPISSCFASAGRGSLSFRLIVVMHLLMPHTPMSRLHV